MKIDKPVFSHSMKRILYSSNAFQRSPSLFSSKPSSSSPPVLQQNSSSATTLPKPTYHKRPLPPQLVALSSREGKILFREAMSQGGMESFFALSEQFITQSDPAFCSLSSLAMVLNALNYDPKRVWKGSWRWVSEEMLQCEASQIKSGQSCCHNLDTIRQNGMDFSGFESLALCHEVNIDSVRVTPEYGSQPSNFNSFRKVLIDVSTSDKADHFIVANFSRKALGQTGDGHFSPIGGFHIEKNLVLIMDVARFKYPPYWVPLDQLWQSMQWSDKFSGLSRGYFKISTSNSAVTSSSSTAAAAAAAAVSSFSANSNSVSSSACACSSCATTSPTSSITFSGENNQTNNSNNNNNNTNNTNNNNNSSNSNSNSKECGCRSSEAVDSEVIRKCIADPSGMCRKHVS